MEQRESASGAICNAAGTERFVGERAGTAIGAEIREITGAAIFQWVPPESAVTMDYRPDRVRVSYDRDMAITRIACG